jgi:hypothetical protein
VPSDAQARGDNPRPPPPFLQSCKSSAAVASAAVASMGKQFAAGNRLVQGLAIESQDDSG